MEKKELFIRSVVSIVLLGGSVKSLHNSTGMEDAIKYVSAALAFFLAAACWLCPKYIVESVLSHILKKDKNMNNEKNNINFDNKDSNFKQLIIVSGTLNGNLSPQYNANEAEEDRNMVLKRALPQESLSDVGSGVYTGGESELEGNVKSQNNN